MNSHVSATIGIRAVDPRTDDDNLIIKEMGNSRSDYMEQMHAQFEKIFDIIASMQLHPQTQERTEGNGSRYDFCVENTQTQIQFLSLDQSPKPAPKRENEGISHIEVVTRSATISKSSNDTKLENEECVEVLKYVPNIATVAMEADSSTRKATEIQEQRVFDEMPESEKLKISDILPPLVLGSEAAEVYNFDVSSPQFQTPLVSTEETKMELECFSLIPSPSLFNSSSDGTKLEDEGFVEVPKYTAVTESQPLASESIFEVFPKLALVASRYINFIGRVETPSWPLFVPVIVEEIGVAEKLPNLSIFELIPIWKIMLDTGQYHIVSGCSRDGVALNLIVSWNMMNEMCWDKHILFSRMKLKGFELDLLTIGVVLGFNSRTIADFQMAEVFVNDLSSSTINSHDHGSACQFLKDGWSDVLVLEIQWIYKVLHYIQFVTRLSSIESRVGQDVSPFFELPTGGVRTSKKKIVKKKRETTNPSELSPQGTLAKLANESLIDAFEARVMSLTNKRKDGLCIIIELTPQHELMGSSGNESYAVVGDRGDRSYGVFYSELLAALKKLLFDRLFSLQHEKIIVSEVDSYQLHLISIVHGYKRLSESLLSYFKKSTDVFVDAGHLDLKEMVRKSIEKKEGKELSDEDNHTFDRNFFYHIVTLFYEDGLLVDSKELADDCEQISLTVGSPPRRKFEYTIGLNNVVFSKNNGNSSFEGDSYGNGALGFEGIHSNLLVNELGEAVRDWEFDDFLPWTTFENGHMIQNSLADRELIIIQMRERPSPKPPFHCRHVSLGDKTLSTGEYCHTLGHSAIWEFTSASYSIQRSCIFT